MGSASHLLDLFNALLTGKRPYAGLPCPAYEYLPVLDKKLKANVGQAFGLVGPCIAALNLLPNLDSIRLKPLLILDKP